MTFFFLCVDGLKVYVFAKLLFFEIIIISIDMVRSVWFVFMSLTIKNFEGEIFKPKKNIKEIN